MSTRVVSFRMTETEYDKMMAECYQKGTGCAEWVQQKIAFANNIDKTLKRVQFKLNTLRRILLFKKDYAEINNRLIELLEIIETNIPLKNNERGIV
jgi:hypothetical protein